MDLKRGRFLRQFWKEEGVSVVCGKWIDEEGKSMRSVDAGAERVCV